MLRALRLLVRIYKVALSPLLHSLGGPGSGCQFQPTCSAYLVDAVELHGVIRGLWLGLKRIGRCHPWGGSGYDPVVPPVNRASRFAAFNLGSE